MGEVSKQIESPHFLRSLAHYSKGEMRRRVFCLGALTIVAFGVVAGERLPLVDVEFRADYTESDEAKGIIIGIGNVELVKGKTRLSADNAVVWYRDSEAYAEGNVIYVSDGRKVVCERAFVNWKQNKGLMIDADVLPAEVPEEVTWYFHSPEVKQIGKGEFEAKDARVTTCDFAKPHTYFRASKVSVVEKDRMYAEDVSYWVLGIPVGYVPYLYRDLKYDWPRFEVSAGSSSDFGTFLFTEVGFDLTKYLELKFELDFMSDRGEAYGVDLAYELNHDITGYLDTYRLNSDEGEDRRNFPLGERDRWRIKFVHQQDVPEGWEIDFELQRWSDAGFREEFFNQEYKTDKPVENRLYIKRTFRDNVAGYFQVLWRENDFFDTTEYLPQFGVNVFSMPVLGGILWTGHFEFANIRRRFSDLRLRPGEPIAKWLRRLREDDFSLPPVPMTIREQLSDDRDFLRIDLYNELSYPTDIGIFNFEPFVGTRQTYYSEQLRESGGDWRNIFVWGARLSTQFWKGWDHYISEFWQLDGLRHIITPELRFISVETPSIEAEELISLEDFYATNPPIVFGRPPRPYHPYDTVGFACGEVDGIVPVRLLNIGVRNRFQTRRNERIVDFLDIDLDIDYYFHEEQNAGDDFSVFRGDIRFAPVQGIYIFTDFEFDTSGSYALGNFEVFNFGVFIDTSERWSLYLGNRYEKGVTNSLQFALDYAINEKWALRTAIDYNTRRGETVDGEIVFQRDMHEWIAELVLGVNRGRADNFVYIRFRPKSPGEMHEGFRFSRAVTGRWARKIGEYSIE